MAGRGGEEPGPSTSGLASGHDMSGGFNVSPFVKVALDYRGGDKRITKVWRFDPYYINYYTLTGVEKELLTFFPEISVKNLGLTIFYRDSFAGMIKLESDSDLVVWIHIAASMHIQYTCSARLPNLAGCATGCRLSNTQPAVRMYYLQSPSIRLHNRTCARLHKPDSHNCPVA